MGRKFGIWLITCICLIGVCFSNVYAYDATIPLDYKNVATWCQGTFPESRTRRLAKGSGDTIGAGACSYFSMAYILVKGGYLDPTKESPIDVIDRVEAYNGWDTDWGHMDGSKVSKLEPDLKCDSYMMSLSDYSRSKAISILKGLYDEGKYLQICIGANATNGHYLFIDSFVGSDDFVIGDSGFKGTKWSDYYRDNGGYFKYVTVYSSKSGKKCNKQASIYSDKVGKSEGKEDIASTEEDKDTYNKIKSEWELVGMPDKAKLSDTQVFVPFPDGVDSIEDSEALAIIGANIQSRKVTPVDVYHWFSSAAGLLLIAYSVLLSIAYLFDYSNTFIEISLLRVVSFGKFKLKDDSDDLVESGWDELNRVTYLTVSMLIVRVAVLMFIGFALVAGWLNRVLEYLLFGI